MNRALAIPEWRRARHSLHAASVCFHRHCYADAVSRAYYAVFHAAKAALGYFNGTAPRSHGAVIQQFGLQLIGNGLIEGFWGSEIGRLYDLRVRADYNVEAEFSAVYARDVYRRAERFMWRILRYLSSGIPFADLT